MTLLPNEELDTFSPYDLWKYVLDVYLSDVESNGPYCLQVIKDFDLASDIYANKSAVKSLISKTAIYGYSDIFRTLIETSDIKALEDAVNGSYHLLLYPVDYYRDHIYEFVKIMVERGADVNARNEQGKTVLDIIAHIMSLESFRMPKNITKKMLATAQLLIDSGIDIDRKTGYAELTTRERLKANLGSLIDELRMPQPPGNHSDQ